MQRRTLVALAALAATTLSAPIALAQSGGDIKIAHVYSRTGPLEAYGKQTQTGLMMGLEYATDGTMTVNGRKIIVIEKDDQGKPDLGKSLLATAYSDDKVDLAVGPTSSGVALAMLPVAEEYKKILLVEPAVADAITGEKWNKYIFRTGRNSSQDAISNAVAVDQDNVSIAMLAQDYAFGRDGVKAFKDALKKAKIVHEEYLPPTTTDFTAGIQRLVDGLKDKPGRKIIAVVWAGGTPPFNALADADLKKRFNIEMGTGGNILPAMAAYKRFPGMEGATYYYYGIPEERRQRLDGGRAPEALQQPAGLLHRGRLLRRHGHRDGAEEDQRRHGDQQADLDDGRHELRHAQGPDDLPQGRPPGHADDVPLPDQGRSRRWPGASRNWSARSSRRTCRSPSATSTDAPLRLGRALPPPSRSAPAGVPCHAMDPCRRRAGPAHPAPASP